MADTDIVQVIAEARIDARSLSEFVFKPANFMVTRRLAPPIHTLNYYLEYLDGISRVFTEGSGTVTVGGRTVKTIAKSAADAVDSVVASAIVTANSQVRYAIANAGYQIIDSFEDGATIARSNEALKHNATGKIYRWGGSLIKTVPAGSTPESTGGFGENSWIEVSDESLRQELSGIGGASILGDGASVFNNLAEFLATEDSIRDGSKVFLASLYQGLDLEGEGRLYTYSKSNPKEVAVATDSGHLSRDYDGKIFIAEFGATGGVVSDNSSRGVDTAALQGCFDVIRANGGGTLSMGFDCTYHLHGNIIAEVSNLDWRLNGSTVVLGGLTLRWEPLTSDYGSYNNVRIDGGIWLGGLFTQTGSSGAIYSGLLMLSLVKVDNVYFTNNKLIECTYSHVLDLMGARYVYFDDNEVLGTSINTPKHNEIVQLSSATKTSFGAPTRPENDAYFDGKPTQYVYFRNNTIKPYTKPTTGITSYPCRPIGDHILPANIIGVYVEDNYIEDVHFLDSSSTNLNECLNIAAYDVSFQRNTIISTTGNTLLAKIKCHTNYHAEFNGFRPWYKICDNKFFVRNPDFSKIKTNIALVFSYLAHSSYKIDDNSQGYDLEVSGNTFDVEHVKTDGVDAWCAFYIETDVKNYHHVIKDNKFIVEGGFNHAVQYNKGNLGKRDGGLVEIINNDFYGSLNSYSILLDASTTETQGSGQESRIVGNKFYNQWKMLRAYPRATLTYSNNIHYNWRLTSFDGDIGDNRALGFDYQSDVIIYDNLVVIPKQKSSYTTTGLPRDFTTGIQPWVGLDAESFYIKESASYKMTYPDGSEPE